MESYLHRVVGLYTSRAEADAARDLIGWGASLDGLIGAVVASERSHGDVSTLIKDALANGQAVLVAHARSGAETAPAQEVVGQHIDPPAVQMSSEGRAAIPAIR